MSLYYLCWLFYLYISLHSMGFQYHQSLYSIHTIWLFLVFPLNSNITFHVSILKAWTAVPTSTLWTWYFTLAFGFIINGPCLPDTQLLKFKLDLFFIPRWFIYAYISDGRDSERWVRLEFEERVGLIFYY